MATAASNKAADSYIGSLICLITKSDIRYEGFLFHLDSQDSTIGLRNVKSYGTEGRKKDGPQISSSDKIYEYIYFRGSDIKDLQVISSPPPQSTSVVPDDPAIIQSHFPNPTPSTMGMTSRGAAQMANVSTSAPSILPVAPFQMNLPPNPLPPGSSLWGSSLPPPPVNINGPALPNNWPGLVGSSGGVSHLQQHRFPPPPQSLVASLPPIQQQGQHQNVNASLAGGSSLAGQHHSLLLPISNDSPNLPPAVPSTPSGQSNPGQPARPLLNLSSIPMPNNASRALPTVAVDFGRKMVSSLEAEYNVHANLDPVTKEPSSIISTSDSFSTTSQTVSSTIDIKDASLSNLSRRPLLTPEVQSEVKDSSSSQPLQTDVQTAQVSVSAPSPSRSNEEIPKPTTKTLHGSTSSHHNRSHAARGRDGIILPEPLSHHNRSHAARGRDGLHGSISYHHNRSHSARGRDGAHRDTSTHLNNRGHAHRGNVPNGAAVYTHQSYRKHASGRGNGLIGAAPHYRQSNMSMGRGKVPNGIPQRNPRNVGSQFRGRGAKNPHVVKRYSEDFDFEAMNEKFNKKEVWDFLGKSNKVNSDDGIRVEEEMDDRDAEDEAEDEAGDGNARHDYKPVYCKDDFFDSLSCHTLDRESVKVKLSEQRKKDAETFGEIQKHPRGRGQGARMHGASYHGRGYDNARGGRGQGRTVWGRVT